MKTIAASIALFAAFENHHNSNNIDKKIDGSSIGAHAFENRYSLSRPKNRYLSRLRSMASKMPIRSSLFDDNEVLSMDANTLSKAIQKERSVTCEQLMKATLARIEEINPTMNAIIMMREKEDLLEEAKACDEILNEFWENSENDILTTKIGWLHGIPIAIKDVSNAKNLPTTMGGSPLFCKTSNDLPVATASDPYVENITRDGAIVIGKTNAPEGGLGSNTFNDYWGKTINPFAVETAIGDLKNNISAGGSSGGAAVAVATKMLVLADGTDNMGSLRNPAGWNNIYSLRPTAGLISSVSSSTTTHSVSSFLPHPASTPGPMARTPRDCAFLLQTMVGNTNKFNAESLWTTALSKNQHKRTIKIGWLGDWNGRIPMEDGILSTCKKALDDWGAASLVSSRIIVEEVTGEKRSLFDLDKLWEAYNTIRFASTFETYSQRFDVNQLLSPLKQGVHRQIKDELVWELNQGRLVDTKELEIARAIYEEYEGWLEEIFSETKEAESSDCNNFNFLALPSAQVWPFPIDDRFPRAIGGNEMDTYHRWMEVCVPVSLGGLPCVTIPAGFGKNPASTALPPLPIGLQLFGKKGDDGKLLRLADEYYHFRSNTGESKDQ